MIDGPNGPVMDAEEERDLLLAVGELALAMGHPCVAAHHPQTIVSMTIREAVRRLREKQE